MTRRRWIADQVNGNRAVITGEHADHLIRVLRAQPGQKFEISTGSSVRTGTIVAMDGQRVEFALAEELPSAQELNVTVAMSIFKFDRMEWAIEKCTELGVTEIVPVIARRTDSHLASAAAKRVERWQRIVREASEQSRRLRPPVITAPLRWNEAVLIPGDFRVLLSETEAERSLPAAMERFTGGSITLAVGPEGGWTEEEEKAFVGAGWIPASLSKTILRAETAAIAAVSVVSAMKLATGH